MFGWLFGRKLSSVVYAEKFVRIKGIRFRIRKINPLDYLDGSKAIIQSYQTYAQGAQKPAEDINIKKLREHYADVFMAGIVFPKLGRKPEEGDFYVNDLFNDWELAESLYIKIMEHTYGKKKMKENSALKS